MLIYVESNILTEDLIELKKNDERFFNCIKESAKRIFDCKNKLFVGNDDSKLQNGVYSSELVKEISERSICIVKGSILESKKVVINVLDVTESERELIKPFIQTLENYEVKIKSINHIPKSGVFKKISYEADLPVINLVITNVSAWNRYYFLTPKL